MSDALFTEAEAYSGDPIRPDMETPTPVSIVATLTRPDREARVRYLIDQAHAIYEAGVAEHLAGRELVASCLLFSGGNDSTTLGHLFRGTATHAVHANTTIGIERTRQFVRDTCAMWDLPLIEVSGNDTYEDLVLGRVTTKNGEKVWPGGFPGPGAHGTMYQRLKERALDKARHELGIANKRNIAAAFIAGRRRQESERRANVPLAEADGSVIWVSPLAFWTKADLATYRLLEGNVPRNQVADTLHMSGECLCGAYAHPGELDEIGYWFPDVKEYIDDLGRRAQAAGVDPRYCSWGHGLGKPSGSGRMCSSCDARQMALPETDEGRD